MIANDYREAYFRLVNNEQSLQRILTYQEKSNTIIKYTGNYIDDLKEIKFNIDNTVTKDNSDNKNIIIDQITLFTTNKNFTDYLPLKFKFANSQIQFDSFDSIDIDEYPIFTQKLGIRDKLKNSSFEEFGLDYTGINHNAIDETIYRITSISSKDDENNDTSLIFIALNKKTGLIKNGYIYEQFLTEILDKKEQFGTEKFKLDDDDEIFGRFKTNGNNVVISDNNGKLYDVNNANLKFVDAEMDYLFTLYLPFSRNNNSFTFAIARNTNLPFVTNDIKIFLIDSTFDDDAKIEFLPDPIGTTNDTIEILSTAMASVLINENAFGLVCYGRNASEFGTFLIVFINTRSDTYSIIKFDPNVQIGNVTLPITNSESFDLFERANLDILLDLNVESEIDIGDQTDLDIINFNFSVNIPAIENGDKNYLIRGKLDNPIYNVIEYEQVNDLVNSIRFRNILLYNDDITTPTDNKPEYNSYKTINGSNNEMIEIRPIKRILSIDLKDYYMDEDLFIELGVREDNDEARLFINTSFSDRNNIVKAFVQDYDEAGFIMNDINGVKFKIIDPPPNFNLELIKIVIDCRIRNSNTKRVDVSNRPRINKKLLVQRKDDKEGKDGKKKKKKRKFPATFDAIMGYDRFLKKEIFNIYN